MFSTAKPSARFSFHIIATSITTAMLLSACTNMKNTPDSAVATTLNPELWPEITSIVAPDAKVESKVAELLADMTLEQKVAQVIQPEIRSITIEDMRKYGFGSYLNGGGAYPNDNKHATPQDWVDLAEAMYQASIDDSIDGSSIPTMWGTDAVHGHNNVIGATLFPHNIGLGAARNPALIKQIAQATAKEVLATGIDWIFAPTVAVAQDDRWGRTYESYSEAPGLVRDYSEAIVSGLQGTPTPFSDDNVIATVKHFVGDGGTIKGDDQGDNISDEQTLIDIHAQGYVGGLTAGAQTVMASFNSWHGSKIHGDKYLLTTVLKERMGFDGLVVGDWNGHGQIKGCTNADCPQAMNAGLDIYMVPNSDWKPLYYNVIEQVKSGVIPLARLDDAVTRILRVKVRSGLFERPSPAQRVHSGKQSLIGAPEHRAIARQAVRESLVLLKNNDNLLPLAANQHILLAGDAADNIGKQSGGWTITWQGTGNENTDFPGATSIYQGIKNKVTAAGGTVTLSQDGSFQEKPDVAIVVFGEEPYAEGNGDIDNLEYQRQSKQDLALLQSLQAQGIPVVSVFISGRPLWVNPELNASTAFVAAWLPGSEGQGLADVLIRKADSNIDYDFTGKLSFSWPRTPTQITNKQDPSERPLFAFGYGMNYADSAQYSNLAELPEDRGNAADQILGDYPLYVGQVKKPWTAGINVNGAMTPLQSSILDTAEIRVQTLDRRVQEDALTLIWKGEAQAEFGLYSPFPEDLLSYQEAEASLQFDYLLSSDNAADLSLKLVCLDKCDVTLPLAPTINANHAGGDTSNAQMSANQWATLSVPLSCLSQQGASFDKVMAPFILAASQPLHIAISDIKIVPVTSAAHSTTQQQVTCSE